MTVSALVCLAPGSEEMEAVIIIDILVRAGINVTTASVAGDGELELLCSRGVRLIADTALVNVSDEPFDVIVLPGGVKGAECFRDSPLLVEKVRQMHLDGKIVAALCASPALVLAHHKLFPVGNITGFPTLKDHIPAGQWQEKRIVYDDRIKLLTAQGPATAIDFSLKLIAELISREKAAEVAEQLILPGGIHNYQPDEGGYPDKY